MPERKRNKGGSSSLKSGRNNRSRTTVNTEVDETNVDSSNCNVESSNNVECSNNRNLESDSHDEDSKTGPMEIIQPSSGSFDLCEWDCCCHHHRDLKREDSGSNQGSVGSEVSFVRVKVSVFALICIASPHTRP